MTRKPQARRTRHTPASSACSQVVRYVGSEVGVRRPDDEKAKSVFASFWLPGLCRRLFLFLVGRQSAGHCDLAGTDRLKSEGTSGMPGPRRRRGLPSWGTGSLAARPPGTPEQLRCRVGARQRARTSTRRSRGHSPGDGTQPLWPRWGRPQPLTTQEAAKTCTVTNRSTSN